MVNNNNPTLQLKKALQKFTKKYFGVTWQNRLFHLLNYIFFIALALVMFYPFYYVLSTSLTVHNIQSGTPITRFSFESYRTILANSGLIRSFLLTIGVVLVFVPIHVLMTMAAAYALRDKKLKGRTFFIFFIIFTMLFSGGLIPYYILIRDLGLRDNLLVYILVGLVSPFSIIVAKNFVQSIPESIFDSAKIDGAGDFYILFKIVFPLSKPIIATISLWAGVAKWNDWMTGVLYMQNSKDKWLIQNFLRNILLTANSSGQGVVDPNIMTMAEGVRMAAIVISVIPIIIIYPWIQKHFVKGILLGSVKG